MALLTPKLLFQIKEIIRKHHTAFVVRAFGVDTVPKSVLEELKKLGVVKDDAETHLDDAYLYGQALAVLEQAKTTKLTAEQVRQFVAKNPVPLTPQEKAAAQTARLTGASYVVGLGNTIEKETGQLLIEADHELREKLREKIADKTALAIEARKTAKQLKSDLGHAMQDWTRNLDRIAITELHNAQQQGFADGVKKRYGGEARVAIRPMPDACAHCKRLHLGPDGQPRIFKLSQLAPPGANVKKPASQWVPCVGALHPHCQCQLVRVPENWGFDKDGSLVPGGTYGVEYDDDTEKSFAAVLAREDDHLERLEKAYRHAGRMEFDGLLIAIEQDVGDLRHWTDRFAGETGTTVMRWPYGFIEGTRGADGEPIDCYVGPNPDAENVYVVDQRKKVGPGKFAGFDEQKVMLGFSSEDEARDAYLAHYDDVGFLGAIRTIPFDEFKRRVVKEPATVVLKGGLLQKPDVRLTITTVLEKAEGVEVTEGERGPNTGSGFQLQNDAPPRPTNPQGADVRLVLRDRQLMDSGTRIVRDPEVYLDGSDRDRFSWVYPLEVVPEQVRGETETFADENRADLERTAKQTLDVARNVTTFTITEGMRPVEPIAKADGGGHKYLAKEWHHGHWVYTYADKKGGKVVPHTTEPGTVVVKVAKEHTADLAALKAKHGLAAPIVEGGKYAMISVPAAEAGKLAAPSPALQKPVQKTPVSKPVPAPPAPAPVAPAGPSFDQKVALASIAAATNMTPEQVKAALTGPVHGDPAKQAARAAIVTALFQNQALVQKDAILSVLDTKAASARVEAVAKGSAKGIAAAKAAYASVPVFDLEALSAVVVHDEPIKGYAVANMKTGLVRVGVRPNTGTWATGDWRHELGHVLHGTFIGTALDEVVKAEHAKAVAKAKANPGKGIDDANWFEATWGVVGPRALDDHREFIAEAYRGYHRALYQQQGGVKQKGSATLDEFRSRHPVMARLFDAHYTAAALGKAFSLDAPAPAPTLIPEVQPTLTIPAPAPPPKPQAPVAADVAVMSKADLKPPPKAGWQLQAGSTVKVPGGAGKVVGWDYQGRMVVDTPQGRRIAPFKAVTVAQAVPHTPSFQKLSAATAVRKPTDLQKSLVSQVLAQKHGGVVAKAYADWLVQRGHEVYLVGGIVRDLIAGTDPKSPQAPGKVLTSMNDVDFVSSAPPDTLRRAFTETGAKAPTTPTAFQQKGCVSNGELDTSSLSSGGVYDAPKFHPDTKESAKPATFDHDLEADAGRRDFTANALYYDVHNDAIIDPSGTGVEDARAKILRRPPGAEWAKNDKLAMRFWKMRARGWTGEPSTTKEILSLAKKELSSMESSKRARYIAKQISKNAKTPAEAVAGLKKVMHEDGAGALYAQYVAPIEKQIAAFIKKG